VRTRRVSQPQSTSNTDHFSVGTDFPFPIPWRNIPENFYVAMRAIFSFEGMGDLAETKKCIASHGIENAFGPLNGDGTTWIMPTLAEASTPVDPMPANVTCTTPIILSVKPAEEQDPELVQWLKSAPTVLVCLGSLFRYDSDRTAIMARAIQTMLEYTNVQVLWKLPQPEYIEEANKILQTYVKEDRVRVQRWLSVSPVSVLETGHIVASVHHGGANSHHEALS
jgi:hypothetical protein